MEFPRWSSGPVLVLLVVAVLLASGFVAMPLATAAPPASHHAAHAPHRPSVSITNFTISPNPIVLGDTTFLNMTITGGNSPYLYNFSNTQSGFCPLSAAPSVSPSYSVTCTPTAAGSYPILAVVIDSSFNSATSPGNLVVNSAPVGPTISSFVATPSSVSVGQSTYLNVSASGGAPPYTYVYTSLPTGCSSSNVSSLLCSPTATGNYTPSITVTDSAGLSASASTPLTVTPSLGPTISSFVAAPAALTIGGSTTLTVLVSGGATPYSYAYTGLPTGCSSTSTSTLSCVSSVTGTFNVNVTVTDHNSRTAKATTSFVVNALPAIASFTIAPSAITLGSSTTLTVTVGGGTSPFSYRYTGLPGGCTSSSTPSLTCTPSVVGTYSISVVATDADGHATSPSTQSLVVNALPSISAFTASPSRIPLENTTFLNVSVSGGTSPYRYVYLGLPRGCSSSNVPSLACTPTTIGWSNVTVDVTDADGRSVNASVEVQITPVPEILAFTASPDVVSPHSVTTFTVHAYGGAQPYSYQYSGLPAGCNSADSASLPCTPVGVGTFHVTVIVTDARGNSASNSTVVTVESGAASGPVVTAFTATPTPDPVGEPAELQVNVTGGSTPYAFSYSGLPPGCTSSDTSTLDCTPTSVGNYSVTVSVTDAADHATSAKVVLAVSGTIEPLVVDLSTDFQQVAPDENFTLTGTIAGGDGPFTYTWSEDASNSSSAPSGDNWTLSLPKSGTYDFRLWVTDYQGVVVDSNSVSVVVKGSSNSGGGSASASSDLPWEVLGLVLVVAILLLFVLLMRRRQTPGGETPEEGAPGMPVFAATPLEAPPTDGPSAGSVPPGLEPGTEEVAVDASGQMTLASPSTPIPQTTSEPTGTICPQCGRPLDGDLCPQCGISWRKTTPTG